ncbi:unnamed protein product, partial [Ectocarpus sp. 12 AP-2014]
PWPLHALGHPPPKPTDTDAPSTSIAVVPLLLLLVDLDDDHLWTATKTKILQTKHNAFDLRLVCWRGDESTHFCTPAVLVPPLLPPSPPSRGSSMFPFDLRWTSQAVFTATIACCWWRKAASSRRL